MNRISRKKLSLTKETLVNLTSDEMTNAMGGTGQLIGPAIRLSIKACVGAYKAGKWLHDHGVLPIRAMNNGPMNAWKQQKANQTKPPR